MHDGSTADAPTDRAPSDRAPSTPRARAAAFFDVDGTLTRTTTMFDFLRFDATRTGRGPAGEQFIAELGRMQHVDGATREAANRRYFSWWAGRRVAEVVELAARWTDQREHAYFHASSRTRLREHLARGDRVVLVSGSVPVLLDGIAAELGAHQVLATSMEVRDSRFTGAVDEPMIGERKTEAVRAFRRSHRIDLERSAGYGDHESDVPFLEAVGRPVMCGSPGSAAWTIASARGWERLSLES